MSTRNRIALALTLLSLVALGLGLFLPALTITLDSRAVTAMGTIEGTVLDETRSILGTIRELHDDDKRLVAGLIFLFSVIVPVAKGALVLLALGRPHAPGSPRLAEFVRRIGKWSMADVMVVAVLLAYLSTHHQEDSVHQSLSVLGMKIDVQLSSQMISGLEPGYWWFAGYCIVSLVAVEFLKLERAESPRDSLHLEGRDG